MNAPKRDDYATDAEFNAATEQYNKSQAELNAKSQEDSGWGLGSLLMGAVVLFGAILSGGALLRNNAFGMTDWIKENGGLQGMGLANMLSGMFGLGEPVFSLEDMLGSKEVVNDQDLAKLISEKLKEQDIALDDALVLGLAQDRPRLLELLTTAGIDASNMTDSEKLKSGLLSPDALKLLMQHPATLKYLTEQSNDFKELDAMVDGKLQDTVLPSLDYAALSEKLRSGADFKKVLGDAIGSSPALEQALNEAINGQWLQKQIALVDISTVATLTETYLTRNDITDKVSREAIANGLNFLRTNKDKLDILLANENGKNGYDLIADLIKQADFDKLKSPALFSQLLTQTPEALRAQQVPEELVELGKLLRGNVLAEGNAAEKALAELDFTAFGEQTQAAILAQKIAAWGAEQADGKLADGRAVTTNLEYLLSDENAATMQQVLKDNTALLSGKINELQNEAATQSQAPDVASGIGAFISKATNTIGSYLAENTSIVENQAETMFRPYNFDTAAGRELVEAIAGDTTLPEQTTPIAVGDEGAVDQALPKLASSKLAEALSRY